MSFEHPDEAVRYDAARSEQERAEASAGVITELLPIEADCLT